MKSTECPEDNVPDMFSFNYKQTGTQQVKVKELVQLDNVVHHQLGNLTVNIKYKQHINLLATYPQFRTNLVQGKTID